jgi:hypothetical protein
MLMYIYYVVGVHLPVRGKPRTGAYSALVYSNFITMIHTLHTHPPKSSQKEK